MIAESIRVVVEERRSAVVQGAAVAVAITQSGQVLERVGDGEASLALRTDLNTNDRANVRRNGIRCKLRRAESNKERSLPWCIMIDLKLLMLCGFLVAAAYSFWLPHTRKFTCRLPWW
jgi:hypothetical protein